MDTYYFTICIILFVIFAATIYSSFKGHNLAKQLLWSWALLLFAAVPFLSLVPSTITSFVAGISLLFFICSLFLSSRTNEEKLETAHEETRRVLRESNTRMDEERRRITRLLHDEVNQKLIASKLELEKLFPLIENNIPRAEEAKKVRTIVERTLGLISSAYEDSRDIIKNTRIEIIDSIGFTSAIEALVGHYKGIVEKPNITFKHNLPKRPALPKATSVNAYRIIGEALLNVVKHAEAKNVAITVQQVGKRFDVSILDDGIGINAKRHGHGIGLIDMRERAVALGTDLHIDNVKGGGTSISFSFSCQGS